MDEHLLDEINRFLNIEVVFIQQEFSFFQQLQVEQIINESLH